MDLKPPAVSCFNVNIPTMLPIVQPALLHKYFCRPLIAANSIGFLTCLMYQFAINRALDFMS